MLTNSGFVKWNCGCKGIKTEKLCIVFDFCDYSDIMNTFSTYGMAIRDMKNTKYENMTEEEVTV